MHVPQSAAGIDRLVIGIDLGATTINVRPPQYLSFVHPLPLLQVGLFNFEGASYSAISRPIEDWDFEAIIAQVQLPALP